MNSLHTLPCLVDHFLSYATTLEVDNFSLSFNLGIQVARTITRNKIKDADEEDERLIVTAYRLLQQNATEEAISLLENLAFYQPFDSHVLMILAECYKKQGGWARAATVYLIMSGIWPKDPVPHYYRCLVLKTSGHQEAAQIAHELAYDLTRNRSVDEMGRLIQADRVTAYALPKTCFHDAEEEELVSQIGDLSCVQMAEAWIGGFCLLMNSCNLTAESLQPTWNASTDLYQTASSTSKQLNIDLLKCLKTGQPLSLKGLHHLAKSYLDQGAWNKAHSIDLVMQGLTYLSSGEQQPPTLHHTRGSIHRR